MLGRSTTLRCAVLVLAGPAAVLAAVEPGSAGPVASLAANRTRGVAPLAVFFDARATTHSDAGVDGFHDLVYDFDFGDPAAGSWGDATADDFLARLPKNRYHGAPLAGHVYETPGRYLARVAVRDARGGRSSAEVAITVEDPDLVFAGSRTVCLAAAGDFTGCPASAQRRATGSFADAMALAQPGTRVLLRRGDHFRGRGSTALSGPGILGAFGSGAPPEISNDDGPPVVSAGSDWRVMDLRSLSPPDSPTHHFTCAGRRGAVENLLLLRVEARGGQLGFGCASPTITTEGLSVVDSVFEDQRNTAHQPYAVFHAAHTDEMFMGNRIGGSRGHNVRFPFARNGFVFAFNKFTKPPAKANFRLHGKDGLETHFAVVSYNTFAPGTRGLNINQVADDAVDKIYDVIVEGNFSPHNGKMFNLGVLRATARNNVMLRVGWGDPMFRIWQRGHRNGPQFDIGDIHIHHNTYVVSSAVPADGRDGKRRRKPARVKAKMVTVREQDGGVFRGKARFADNLVYAPDAIVDAFPVGPRFTAAGNRVVENAADDPFPVAMPGTRIGDYALREGSAGARLGFLAAPQRATAAPQRTTTAPPQAASTAPPLAAPEQLKP